MLQIDQYASVVIDEETAMFHGALLVNSPTPSGADRFLLQKSCTIPRRTTTEALDDISVLHPGVACASAQSLDVPENMIPPRGSEIMVISPKDRQEPRAVEVRVAGERDWNACELSIDDIEAMAARRIISLHTSSGADPELSAIYDTYVVVKSIATVDIETTA